MVFSSGVFIFLFLPALLILYYVFARSRAAKNITLLITSLLFYAWGEPVFVFIMLASIVFNWYITLIMSESERKKFWLIIAISLDVALLGVFKYAGFIMGHFGVTVNIALPIGISFFTFQMMSYVFDVYYGRSHVQKNLFYVALYISFFPQLIAGPIVRYNQIESEIETRNENFNDFSEGVRRFIYGLGKKVLLANFIAQISDNIFDYMINPSVLMSWLGAVSYTLQVYFDFSGYSDMAIGLGLMFGFHFAENFNYPYLAKSISDYWKRWHISLTSWFNDYVYMPRVINQMKMYQKRDKNLIFRLYVKNTLIVWLLTGLWHGAAWTYIAWGLFYFMMLVFEQKTGFTKKLGVFSHVYTMFIVIIAHVIYRAASFSKAGYLILSMFALNGNALYDASFIYYMKGSWVILIAGFIGIFPVSRILSRAKWIEICWLMIVLALSLLEVISSSYNPFIYFNF